MNLSQEKYYLSFSTVRIEKIVSYMKDKKYTTTEINKLFKTKESKETEYLKIVGILAINQIDKIGNKLIKNYNEQELRDKISEGFDQFQETFEKFGIKKENIKSTNDKKDFDIQAFLKLVIAKQDLDILENM